MLNCTIKALVRAAFKAIFLRHGCTECEAEDFDVETGVGIGGNIALASIRKDGREIYRVYDLEDLDGLLSDPGRCSFIATALRKITSRNRYGPVHPPSLEQNAPA